MSGKFYLIEYKGEKNRWYETLKGQILLFDFFDIFPSYVYLSNHPFNIDVLRKNGLGHLCTGREIAPFRHKISKKNVSLVDVSLLRSADYKMNEYFSDRLSSYNSISGVDSDFKPFTYRGSGKRYETSDFAGYEEYEEEHHEDLIPADADIDGINVFEF